MVNMGIIYKSLTDEDFKVLASLEKALIEREYVSLQLIEKTSNIYEDKLRLILTKLHGLKLVKAKIISSERAYRLTTLGYDMLAIRALVKTDVIEAIGDKVGVGKESDIYLGLSRNGLQVVIKLLRIGRTSFRQTLRKREWAIMDRKLSWYEQSKVAAQREYNALKELTMHNALVPRPLGYNRHVVVVEYIDGIELYKRPMLKGPESVLRDIITTIKIAYNKAMVVHSDLSEYNILIRRIDEKPFIIDWPQYVHSNEQQAAELLRRDVYYIVRFFRRIYGVKVDPDEILANIIKNSLNHS